MFSINEHSWRFLNLIAEYEFWSRTSSQFDEIHIDFSLTPGSWPPFSSTIYFIKFAVLNYLLALLKLKHFINILQFHSPGMSFSRNREEHMKCSHQGEHSLTSQFICRERTLTLKLLLPQYAFLLRKRKSSLAMKILKNDCNWSKSNE